MRRNGAAMLNNREKKTNRAKKDEDKANVNGSDCTAARKKSNAYNIVESERPKYHIIRVLKCAKLPSLVSMLCNPDGTEEKVNQCCVLFVLIIMKTLFDNVVRRTIPRKKKHQQRRKQNTQKNTEQSIQISFIEGKSHT